MSTKKWFARKQLTLESETIVLNVPAANQLLRKIGATSTPLAVTSDVPTNDVVRVDPTVGFVIPTAAGSYLTFSSIEANTNSITLTAPSTINIVKKGNYVFHILLDVVCGANVPCEVWCRIWVGGISFSGRTVYLNGGAGAPLRSLAFIFIHQQPDTGGVLTPIQFEIQGDSIPNGTAITVLNTSRLFVEAEGIPPV